VNLPQKVVKKKQISRSGITFTSMCSWSVVETKEWLLRKKAVAKLCHGDLSLHRAIMRLS